MRYTVPLFHALAAFAFANIKLTAQVPTSELELLGSREKALTAELEKNSDSLSLLSSRGDLRQFMSRFPEAVSDFEKMIALDPAQDAPHWRLGIAYYFVGSYPKSAKQFEKYHAYDGGDRENGIWNFMARAQSEGVDVARNSMLKYERFDREPFPALYDMFAGKIQPEEVLKHVTEKGLEDKIQVVFFAKYYVGVYLTLTGKKEAGLRLIDESVALFTPATAGKGGPGYMWQVARLHAGLLR